MTLRVGETQICYCRRHDLIFCDRHGPTPCFCKDCDLQNVTDKPHQYNPMGCAICSGLMRPSEPSLHFKVQVGGDAVKEEGNVEKITTLFGSYYNVWEAGIIGPASRCSYCGALVRTVQQMQDHTLNCTKHPSKVNHAEDRTDTD